MAITRAEQLSRLVSKWRYLLRLWATFERTGLPEDYGECRRVHKDLEICLDQYAKRYFHGRPDGLGRSLALGEVVRQAQQMQLTIVD